jgi:predicted kinase
MPSLFLLRGLPGAGKSTLAIELSENGKYPIFSVDDYFTEKSSGNYIFNFAQNYLAYQLCQENTRKCMIEKTEKIFIHNTFTIEWELEPYFIMAAFFNYKVFVVTVENRHKKGNIHNISNEQLQKMAEKYKVSLF